MDKWGLRMDSAGVFSVLKVGEMFHVEHFSRQFVTPISPGEEQLLTHSQDSKVWRLERKNFWKRRTWPKCSLAQTGRILQE